MILGTLRSAQSGADGGTLRGKLCVIFYSSVYNIQKQCRKRVRMVPLIVIFFFVVITYLVAKALSSVYSKAYYEQSRTHILWALIILGFIIAFLIITFFWGEAVTFFVHRGGSMYNTSAVAWWKTSVL